MKPVYLFFRLNGGLRGVGLLVCLLFSPVSLYAVGDPVAGRQKAEVCAECHGFDGVTPDPIVPKLNGQFEDFLYKQVMQYMTGTRYDIVMNTVINKVRPSVTDIEDITAFYSGLPRMSGNKVLTAIGQRGKTLYINKNCLFCHNDYDRSKGIFISKTAVIGGQNREYLFKSLKDIQNGIRKADPFNLMERILKQMIDDDIYALAEYLSSL